MRVAELRLVMPGTLESVDPAVEALVGLAREHGLPEQRAYELRVAVHEALINAVRHGSRSDPAHRIRVGLRVGRHWLRIDVADEGPGFDPRRLADPLAEENLTRSTGRGVFYMRRLTDGVTFSFPRRGGTVVCLRKRLSRPPGRSSMDRGSRTGRSPRRRPRATRA